MAHLVPEKCLSTARRAVEICLGQDKTPAEQAAVRDRYQKLVEEGRIGFVTFHQSYTYEDFVEGLRPRPMASGAGFTLEPEAGILKLMAGARVEADGQSRPYHRRDQPRQHREGAGRNELPFWKRTREQGAPAAVTVTLPYSKSAFSLPANLYIIGTMNTADRSISLLDTALRRRFVFEELPPDTLKLVDIKLDDKCPRFGSHPERNQPEADLLPWGGTPRSAMRGSWGERQKADLDRIMAFKVIPLLREYFHDDLERVRIVLGEGTVLCLGRRFLRCPRAQRGWRRIDIAIPMSIVTRGRLSGRSVCDASGRSRCRPAGGTTPDPSGPPCRSDPTA